jgi:hypothetical protein
MSISKQAYFNGRLLPITYLLYVRRVVSQHINAVQNQTIVSIIMLPHAGHNTASPKMHK